MSSIKLRLYQESILGTASSKNTLAVIPTGLGKTAIAAMLIKHRLALYPKSKVVFLAPTRPLVEQHEKTLIEFLGTCTSFSGSTPPSKRKELWENNSVFVSTPQGFENDVISSRISLKDVSVIVFDEAHRAVGDYSYVYLAKKYMEDANHPRILGLTASPGSDEETILNVCLNLSIEDLEYRSVDDADVAPYVQDINIDYIKVELPEDLLRVKMFLDKCFVSKLEEASKLGFVSKDNLTYSKTSLLKLISELHSRVSAGERDFEVLKTISLLSESLKVQHAQDLIETQDVAPLIEYLEGLEKQALTSNTKAVKNLVRDVNFRSALIAARALRESNFQHPKIDAVKSLILDELERDPASKIIIFSQFRDTGIKLKSVLDANFIKCEVFTGQAKKKNVGGLSQKNQKLMIEQFKEDKFSCLIATSVGEEGLDIPEVNLVLFYEPVPSAIRTVQRRGRTGRHKAGRVVVLVTSNTRDESNRWVAHHKEKRMYRVLKNIKDKVSAMDRREQKTIVEFDQKPVSILVDFREKGSSVMKSLMNMGASLELKSLSIGDFHLTENVVVEYKTVKDFVDSIIDGRLLSQARELKQYHKPFFIVEGDEDVYAQRKIHPNAIRGMIYTLTSIMKIPIIFTKNPKDTAAYLIFVANKEQSPDVQDFQMHQSKPFSNRELQEYIISSLPGVGSKLAPSLLEHFKSVKNVINASASDLQIVDLIGQKKAQRIKEIVDAEYEVDK
ncbi:MAG: DEAD/DEAH box helicase [Candidatus Woesearchaeota archaeon]